MSIAAGGLPADWLLSVLARGRSMETSLRLRFETTNVRMTLHFVAHALREVESSIRDVLLPRDFQPPRAETQTAEILAICASLGFARDDGPVTNWVSLAGRLHQLAHRRALALPSEGPLVIQRLVSSWDSVLDPLLEKYEAQYQVVVPQLIALAVTPSPSEIDLKHLQNDLPNNFGALGVFFDKIQSGAWLPLIEKAGYFENSPPLDYDAEAGTIRAPRWPQAEYLARFAS